MCSKKKVGEKTRELPESPFGEVILCLIVSNSAPLWQKLWKANVEWHTSNCIVPFDILMHVIEDLPFMTFARSMGSPPDRQKFFPPSVTWAMGILFAARTHSLLMERQWLSHAASRNEHGFSPPFTGGTLNYQSKERKSPHPVLGKINQAKCYVLHMNSSYIWQIFELNDFNYFCSTFSITF